MSRLSQLGVVSEAPSVRTLEHRAQWRSISLEASSPHRMIRGVSAFGAGCRHFTFSQLGCDDCDGAQGVTPQTTQRLTSPRADDPT